ncbi:MAG: DUF1549 domain-containing protein, partial [Gemmataceae bacterium]|nr:DUF1549 domain-containing protein [Gemmataceae bacterium]
MNTAWAVFLVPLFAPQVELQTQYPFDSPTRHTIPTFTSEKDQKWVRNPLDGFILKKIKEAGLEPAPRARSETLLRRLFIDLTGLPPT